MCKHLHVHMGLQSYRYLHMYYYARFFLACVLVYVLVLPNNCFFVFWGANDIQDKVGMQDISDGIGLGLIRVT